jgi:O-acetyl-ADP-ribose deacetylase (regulator of RNase III)
MTKIKYIKGDATEPVGDGQKIIVHISNNERKWGRGFVLALSNKWAEPEAEFYKMKPVLGNVHLVKVTQDITVANMISQDGIISEDNPHPIDYDTLHHCLKSVNLSAIRLGASIHMPKIGSGLGGGDWDVIEHMIEAVFDVDVTVYEFG